MSGDAKPTGEPSIGRAARDVLAFSCGIAVGAAALSLCSAAVSAVFTGVGAKGRKRREKVKSAEELETVVQALKRQLEDKQRKIDYLGLSIKEDKKKQPRTKGTHASAEEHPMKTIGYMESPWPDRRSTPRQGSLVPSSVGRLKFLPYVHPTVSLDDVEDFSHLWLVWVFHKNTKGIKPSKKKDPFSGGMGLRAKIRVPRLRIHKKKAGLFSTRTPHRPNPIGLSLCKIIRVDKKKGEILLSGVDLVSGTPILDVKPYIPYSDAPGSLTNTRVPSWIRAPAAIARVRWTEEARKQLSSLAFGYLKIFEGNVEVACNTLAEAVTNEAIGRPLSIQKLPPDAHPEVSDDEERKVYRIRMEGVEATYLILRFQQDSSLTFATSGESKNDKVLNVEKEVEDDVPLKEILMLSVGNFIDDST